MRRRGHQGDPLDLRSGTIFLANFDNPANRDAVDWMLADIWPRIRAQLPSAELLLVGNNLPSGLGVGQNGVMRVGFVADLDPVFANCRVAVSPVRFGTGIKTKNLSALSHGVPLVTTTVGADGIHLHHDETALIADCRKNLPTPPYAPTPMKICGTGSRGKGAHTSPNISAKNGCKRPCAAWCGKHAP